MDLIQKPNFYIIGISIKTSNSDYNQLQKDMQTLWSKFISNNIMAQIPNKIDTDIYCIYTDYEGDYTKPYTAIVGCKVESLTNIPAGLIGKSIDNAKYSRYVVKGNLSNDIVFTKWKEIWSIDKSIPRTYIADFEIYGNKATNPEDAEVEILIGIK